MAPEEMKKVKEGDLVVHMYTLKEWKTLPSLVVDVGENGKVTIMNPMRGLVDVHLSKWEFVHEDR